MKLIYKIEIKFGQVEDIWIIKMLRFPDFIFSLLLPNFEKIKSVKLKITFVSPNLHMH